MSYRVEQARVKRDHDKVQRLQDIVDGIEEDGGHIVAVLDRTWTVPLRSNPTTEELTEHGDYLLLTLLVWYDEPQGGYDR